MSERIVRARNVRKRLGGKPVLKGVDLDVYRGEITLLLGPNGSGKTVLQSCLAGGLTVSEGEVDVFGEPPGTVGERLAYMLQGGLAMRALTGRENAQFYADIHPRSTGDWERLAAEFGIEDDLDRRVRTYSGGTTRKLELAITLGTDVPLYFLDEPTAQLDMTTVDRLHARLDALRDDGKSIVLSSHLPGDARLADRLVFVRDGEIVTRGRPEELLEAVPRVVTVDAAGVSLGETLLADQWFDGRGDRRGFLADDASRDDVSEIAGTGVHPRLEEPTVTDLFNYYVHVLPQLDDSTTDGG